LGEQLEDASSEELLDAPFTQARNDAKKVERCVRGSWLTFYPIGLALLRQAMSIQMKRTARRTSRSMAQLLLERSRQPVLQGSQLPVQVRW
jgi:hypothetical protein